MSPPASRAPVSILQIVADGAPGGGTTAVLGLCEDARAQSDFHITLITQPSSYAAAEAQKMGIDVCPFDFFTSRFDPRLPAKLGRQIDRLKPDIIHVHGARAAHALTALPFRKRAITCIYTVHGYHFADKLLPLKILGWLAERRIAAQVDDTIFVSEGDRAKAARYRLLPRMKKSRVILNGIDLRACENLRDTPKTHDLVFMARMHAQKNPLLMIDIMCELKAEPWRLLMIGGGEMEEQVRAYAAAKNVAAQIDFTGALPHDEALRGIAAGRVYVLPSLWEGLPIAPIEAMGCGVPVVASHIPGTDEVVADGVTGLLVKKFDARAYAAAIRKILGDRILYNTYARQSLDIAQRRFARAHNSQAYIQLYREKI